jgi:hypothetical protein
MTSQGLMPARNAALSSHRPGKLLNNSKWPLSKFSWAMTIKTSIQRGHQALDVIMHNVFWLVIHKNEAPGPRRIIERRISLPINSDRKFIPAYLNCHRTAFNHSWILTRHLDRIFFNAVSLITYFKKRSISSWFVFSISWTFVPCRSVFVSRRHWNLTRFTSIKITKAKKKICGFPVSSYKNLGRVGRF